MIKWFKHWIRTQIAEETSDTKRAVYEYSRNFDILHQSLSLLQREIEALNFTKNKHIAEIAHLEHNLNTHRPAFSHIAEARYKYLTGQEVQVTKESTFDGSFPNHEIIGMHDHLSFRLIKWVNPLASRIEALEKKILQMNKEEV